MAYEFLQARLVQNCRVAVAGVLVNQGRGNIFPVECTSPKGIAWFPDDDFLAVNCPSFGRIAFFFYIGRRTQ